MKLGKTIQIYLPDGNPRGVKVADITSMTVRSILIPRSKLEESLSQFDFNIGIYFLVGLSNEDSKPILYIGETENAKKRLKQHNQKKEFWNFVIFIDSKTKYFTKTHIKYLEWLCYSEAHKTNRYKLENPSIPSKPFVPKPIESDLFDNFETLKILVSTLGFPIFDQIKKPRKQSILICQSKNIIAEGEYIEDGFVVFAGSKSNLFQTNKSDKWVRNVRNKLIENGILKKEEDTYVFSTDYIFPSPSTAATAVLGRRANGWTNWKYKNGKSLDEVIRKSN